MNWTDERPENLEDALRSLEAAADAAIKSLAAATKEAKRAKSAAALGKVRELQGALDSSVRAAEHASSAVAALRKRWSFDVGEWFAGDGYLQELLAAARHAGVDAYASDGRILSYPVIVEVSAADATVMVEKRKHRAVRPSVVVGTLSSLQQRPPKFKPEPFLETLAAAYDLVVAKMRVRDGSPVKLVDVHRVLTLLPGAARDYTRFELARDLYLLDQSGFTTTKDGRRISLPASAMTRGSGVLTTVTRGGQTKVYAGVAFSPGAA